jgi:hypothetical protein
LTNYGNGELAEYGLENVSAGRAGFPIQVAILARACFHSCSSRALLSRSLYRTLAVSKCHLMNGPEWHPLQLLRGITRLVNLFGGK